MRKYISGQHFIENRTVCLLMRLKMLSGYSIIKAIIARNKRLVGRWNMLEKIIELTNEYIEEMPKKERKKYGQFFTSIETARYMAGLYHTETNRLQLRVLDAGAGSGILTCALIERLDKIEDIKEIIVTCYENDEECITIITGKLYMWNLK